MNIILFTVPFCEEASVRDKDPDGPDRVLERAAAAIGRLDAALADHPLALSWRYRSRLDAAIRMADSDGVRVDPMRLAGILENLTLTPLRGASFAERAAEADAIRHALDQFEAVSTAPNASADAKRALGRLEESAASGSVLRGLARGVRQWTTAGLSRAAIRAAVPWLLASRLPTGGPLDGVSGIDAFRADAPWDDSDAWEAVFLGALADEAAAGRDRLSRLTILVARAQTRLAEGTRKRRADSQAPRALTILVSTPVIGPVRLAGVLGSTVRGAAKILDELVTLGAAVEVTGRRSHKLYGLADLADLRDLAPGPRRRPVRNATGASDPAAPLPPLRPRLWDEPARLYADLAAAGTDLVHRSRRVARLLATGPSR